ncbi:hypothetical protein ACIBQ1_57135 [Nonomuraea sp. NPDC050153]|uniref:hypothetical protein n=1 Tax=Nonomuraea sp. NPDC050153 TaxID=3364359 RepID=UPI0037AA6293
MTLDLDDVVKSLAPAPGPGLTPTARELMTQIMDAAEPAPKVRLRRWRPLVALPIAAAVTAAGWAAAAVLGAAPASALNIKEEGDHYLIEVKDLYAAPEVYESQLRAAGIHVSLRVAPVTPSFVGEIATDTTGWSSGPFPYADKIKTIDRPGGCGLGRGCPIGLTIAKDFTGTAEITLGREARPGEEYEITGMLHAPKEPLHCAPFYNRRVSEVRASLAKLGLTISGFAVKKPGDPDAEPDLRASVPDSMYVHGGGLSEYGKADLVVSEEPMPDALVRTILTKEGCPADPGPTS